MSHKSPKTKAEDEIDENLRRVYQQVLEEDIPDRFKNLLSQLKTSGGEPQEEREGKDRS